MRRTPRRPARPRLCWSRFAAAAAAWTFHGALAYGFSQDDYLGLARAGGLAARLPFGWRWLSHQLWWDIVAGPLGASATAAHVVSLAAHAATAALLAVLLARRLGAPAALVGAAFFATHPSAFTAVYWAAANGDLFATLFSLLALACACTPRARFMTPVAFALALLAKEAALPLPLTLGALFVLWPAAGAAPWRPWRDRAWIACVLVALAFALANVLGARTHALGGEAYALSLPAVPANLSSYAGWLANRWLATVRSFSDAVDPGVFAWAIALGLAWSAGAFVPALRRSGWLAAGAAWVLMLAPVLPLAAHTYHYYAYAALPAAGLLLAALAAVIVRPLPRPAAWVLAGALATFFVLDGSALVARIEQAPFLAEGLRADPTVDRARIAANALADLRAAHLPPHASVLMWSPQSQAMAANAHADPTRESYYESNVRAALLDGLAVRVALPGVEEVKFVRAFASADSLAWWAVYRYDGRLHVVRGAELARTLARPPA